MFVALADTIDTPRPADPAARGHADARSGWTWRSAATPTFQSLRGYTARSAEPVGRLLLALFGYRDPELVRYADELSTALQLTNFWQDVAADAARDHIYLPAEDLHFFGVTEADIKALKPTAVTARSAALRGRRAPARSTSAAARCSTGWAPTSGWS